MTWLLLAAALAGSPARQAEQAAEMEAEVRNASEDLRALLAYARDTDLMKAGFAPDGWVQPELDVYLSEDAPPSQLPVERIEVAVEAGKAPMELLTQYREWLLRQEEEEAEEGPVLTTPSEVTVEAPKQ
jgi:hypothetical protein